MRSSVRSRLAPPNSDSIFSITSTESHLDGTNSVQPNFLGRNSISQMRWSGLAIKDAVTLERQRLGIDGRLFLYRAKTGVPVYVPLPANVVQILHALPNSNPRYFFLSGNGDPETVKKGWQRTLRHLFRNVAKIMKPDGTPKRCHPHMFRDTFALELLLSGVPIDQVSLLLGHSSVKITKALCSVCESPAGATRKQCATQLAITNTCIGSCFWIGTHTLDSVGSFSLKNKTTPKGATFMQISRGTDFLGVKTD